MKKNQKGLLIFGGITAAVIGFSMLNKNGKTQTTTSNADADADRENGTQTKTESGENSDNSGGGGSASGGARNWSGGGSAKPTPGIVSVSELKNRGILLSDAKKKKIAEQIKQKSRGLTMPKKPFKPIRIGKAKGKAKGILKTGVKVFKGLRKIVKK